MASWTNPILHSTADVLAVTDWNGVANNTTFLYEAPYFAAGISGSDTQSLATDNPGPVSLDTELFGGYGCSLNSGGIEVPLTGIYHADGVIGLGAVASGVTVMQILHQGSLIFQGSAAMANINSNTSAGSCLVNCNAGDVISLWGYQNSGSTLSIDSFYTQLHVFFVGSV